MTSKTNKIRNAREANRKFKKKANPLAIEKVVFIDYKDVSLLQRFMSDRSKIRGQRMSGTNVQQQRDLATAIKNAREMALLPYTKRTVSTRALAQVKKAVKTKQTWSSTSSQQVHHSCLVRTKMMNQQIQLRLAQKKLLQLKPK
jgi:small subunit ribosomal protein S18